MKIKSYSERVGPPDNKVSIGPDKENSHGKRDRIDIRIVLTQWIWNQEVLHMCQRHLQNVVHSCFKFSGEFEGERLSGDCFVDQVVDFVLGHRTV